MVNTKDSIINCLFNKYSLKQKDKKILKKIILPIIKHPEFQKRLTSVYPHHGSITLGEHIIEDAILTYQLSKKYMKKCSNYQTDLAIKIAMFHDLYTIPWQNNKDSHVKHFFHKHGFRHPIEAVINSINWYPEYFKSKNASRIIIDGILHHMYPLPVMFINFNKIDFYELKNKDLYNKLSKEQQDIIEDSLKRKRIGSISICRSKYIEGRIMAKADRKVSRSQIKDLASLKSLFTGHNKKIK